MRCKVQIILWCVVLFFASCKWDKEPQYSPVISNTYFLVYHADSLNTMDTLKISVEDDEYVIEEIVPGDTVRYGALLNAVTNQLTSFTIKTDTNYLDLSLVLSDDFLTALEGSSDVENGVLNFKTGYGVAALGINYIAKKSGTPKVTMELSTTSEFSPTKISFIQKIK